MAGSALNLPFIMFGSMGYISVVIAIKISHGAF